MKEPSVLDYLHERLQPWKKQHIDLNRLSQTDSSQKNYRIEEKSAPVDQQSRSNSGWFVISAILLGFFAQFLLEPPRNNWKPAIAFYGLAIVFLVIGYRKDAWDVPAAMSSQTEWQDKPVCWRKVFLSVPFLFISFLLFGSEKFNIINSAFWLAGLVLMFAGFYSFSSSFSFSFRQFFHKKINLFFWRTDRFTFSIPRWTVFLGLLFLLSAVYRFYHLALIPKEMFSDHAEKLLDVADVLDGNLWIFYPRNTGREAFQMFLTAMIANVFHIGLRFMSLKLGTALSGFLTLPFIYLLGKEVGGKRLGAISLFLAGIAYWPNVISRIGLRFPLYPLFAAPALYFLIKALKTGDRNQFIGAGIALGLGLHGYSPMRIVPFVVVMVVAVFLLYPISRGNRSQAWLGFIILALFAMAVFLPLMRYGLAHPDEFSFRAFSRLGSIERPIPGSVPVIFFQNLINSVLMLFWKNGNIWVHSVPNRPALDMVTAVFMLYGMGVCLYRAIFKRSWVDAVLLILVPAMMLPSILSLAFPEENPSLNRSGGAIVPVFIIAAIGVDAVLGSLISRTKPASQRWSAGVLAAFLCVCCLGQNYHLVFHEFRDQYDAASLDTSDIGAVIDHYAHSVGSYDTAYVIPYPYWVDTRLVAINAGVPAKDYALTADRIHTTLDEPRNKLFILHPKDQASLEIIQKYYPESSVYKFHLTQEGKDFLIVQVPPMH